MRMVGEPGSAFESRQNRGGEIWRRLRDVAIEAGTASDAGHLPKPHKHSDKDRGGAAFLQNEHDRRRDRSVT